MRLLLVSLIIAFVSYSPAFAKDVSDAKEFKMTMPYSIQCAVDEHADKINVAFSITTAELTIKSTLQLRTNQQPTHIEGILNSFFSAGILLPFYIAGAMDYENYDSNILGVSKAEIVKVEPYTHQKVAVIFNGIDLGELETDDGGNITLQKSEDGVYDLITSSDSIGITYEKQIFVSASQK